MIDFTDLRMPQWHSEELIALEDAGWTMIGLWDGKDNTNGPIMAPPKEETCQTTTTD